MKTRLCTLLAIALATAGVPAALAAEPTPCAVSAQETADGAVRLSNEDDPGGCKDPEAAGANPAAPANPAMTAEPAAAPEPAAEARAATARTDQQVRDAKADAAQDAANAAQDPLMQHRDAMLSGDGSDPRVTPARSRRYKMMDKATWQATILGGPPTTTTTTTTTPAAGNGGR